MLLTVELAAQSSFIRRYNGAEIHPNAQVGATPDGGFVTAGDLTFSADTGDTKAIWIMKFGPCDELQWSKRYTIGGNRLSVVDLHVTQEGNILIAGYVSENWFYSSFIIKFSPSGEVLFQKRASTGKNLYIYSIGQLTNGNYFVYGNWNESIPEDYGNYIMKIDQNGDVVANNAYFKIAIWGKAVETSDGGVLSNTGRIVYKTNSLHEFEWAQSVSGTSYYNSTPIEVADGYIYARYNHSLTNDQPAFLFKLSFDGQLMWQSEGFESSSTTRIVELPDGNILAVGSITRDTLGVYKTHTLYTVVSPEGVVLNQYFQLPEALEHKWSESVDITPNSDIIHVGTDESSEFNLSNHNLVISKLNYSDVLTGCDLIPTDTRREVLDLTLVPMDVEPHPFSVTYEDLTIIPVNESFVEEEICYEKKPLTIDLGADIKACPNDAVVIGTNDVYNFYKWNSGEETQEIVVNSSGTYILVAGNDCDTVTDTIAVSFYPTVDLEYRVSPRITTPLEAVTFQTLNAPYDSVLDVNYDIFWMVDGDTVVDREFYRYFDENGRQGITYEVIDDNGCKFRDSIYVTIDYHTIFIPNAITPDGDGLNDVFAPKGFGLESYEMKIFNRWGELMFEGENVGWDGTLNGKALPTEVYIYQITFQNGNGDVEDRYGKVSILK